MTNCICHPAKNHLAWENWFIKQTSLFTCEVYCNTYCLTGLFSEGKYIGLQSFCVLKQKQISGQVISVVLKGLLFHCVLVILL